MSTFAKAKCLGAFAFSVAARLLAQGYPRVFCFVVVAATLLSLPSGATAQSGTLTDDAFVSRNPVTQAVNLNGQGTSLIVAGSSATVGSLKVGTSTAYIKFQLQSSLPPAAGPGNIAKATLKLYVSPGISPSGGINFYPVTSAWTESTLNPSFATDTSGHARCCQCGCRRIECLPPRRCYRIGPTVGGGFGQRRTGQQWDCDRGR